MNGAAEIMSLGIRKKYGMGGRALQSCAAGNRSNNHEMISFGTVRKEMGMKTFDIEQYSRRIVESKPSQRVSWLIDATREKYAC